MIFIFLWALLSLFFLCGALVERYYLSTFIDLSEYEIKDDAVVLGIGVPFAVAEDWSSPEDGVWDDETLSAARARRGDLDRTGLTVKQVREEMGSQWATSDEQFAREWLAAVERLLDAGVGE